MALDGREVAVLCDYDGTLARIVERPEDAVPISGATEVLARLVQAVRVVGVVSGRPVDVLRERLPVPGVVLVGQYGLERLVDGALLRHPGVAEHADAVARARREAQAAWPELDVEAKGDVAFTVHWRRRPDRDVGGEVHALAERHGLHAQEGRRSCEVRPPIALDKGTVVADLVAGCAGAVFMGDDAGDLPAFAALSAVAVPLRVGVGSKEEPEGLRAAVDVVVDGPEGAVALAGSLASGFSRPR